MTFLLVLLVNFVIIEMGDSSGELFSIWSR